jgi:hypothetical protein
MQQFTDYLQAVYKLLLFWNLPLAHAVHYSVLKKKLNDMRMLRKCTYTIKIVWLVMVKSICSFYICKASPSNSQHGNPAARTMLFHSLFLSVPSKVISCTGSEIHPKHRVFTSQQLAEIPWNIKQVLGRWCNEKWQEKLVYFGKTPPEGHFAHHKFYKTWFGIEPTPTQYYFEAYCNLYLLSNYVC